jgi:type VI secretion system protein VasD
MLRVDVAAASDANRGPGGQGLPIVVRLYELRAQGAFSGADFFSLYDREAKALGGELIAREELTLSPGQTRQIVKPLDPQARYLGVLAAFRDLDHAEWRDLVPLADGKDNNLAVAVGAKAVRAQPR